MKFRALPGTDLLVSEVGLVLDEEGGFSDRTAAERALRLAYDEGVNLFLFTGAPQSRDAAFVPALGGDRRAKVRVALRLPWTGDGADLTSRLDARLASLGASVADILILEGLTREDLLAGAAGDAIHRLRARGRIGHAGLHGSNFSVDDLRLIERNGLGLIEGDIGPRPSAADDGRLPVLAAAPVLDGIAGLSFLWQDTGRTAGQSAVQIALAHPSVCSVLVRPRHAVELRELARAPLAPPLLPAELASARALISQPVEA